VTLPLSYSRNERNTETRTRRSFTSFHRRHRRLATVPVSVFRSLVGREGFEPPYREAGQIYSLLPLTTRPPARAQEKQKPSIRFSPRDPRAIRTRQPRTSIRSLEPAKGFEPATFRLQIGCSTVELRRRCDSEGRRPIAVYDLAVLHPPSRPSKSGRIPIGANCGV
jgi:hypothetical protein